MTKFCQRCQQPYERKSKEMETEWARRKYCSRVCARLVRKAWVSR